MALIDNSVGRRVDIPHEPGEWMELRRLTLEEMDLARQIKLSALVKEVGSLDLSALKQMVAAGDTAVDPIASVDVMEVLKKGILRWSYDAEPTIENVKQLDDETARWAAREIVQAPTAEQRKNSSNGSTDALTATASRPMSGYSRGSVKSSKSIQHAHSSSRSC